MDKSDTTTHDVIDDLVKRKLTKLSPECPIRSDHPCYDEKPNLMSNEVFECLLEYTTKLLPHDRKALLCFDHFKYDTICPWVNIYWELGLIENRKKCLLDPPAHLIVMQVKYLVSGIYQNIGTLGYYDYTNRKYAAKALLEFMKDVRKAGLHLIGSCASGQAEIMLILHELGLAINNDNFLSYDLCPHQKMIHIFDPSWLMRKLRGDFCMNDIKFTYRNQNLTASYDYIAKVIALPDLDIFKHEDYYQKTKTTSAAVKMFSKTMNIWLDKVEDCKRIPGKSTKCQNTQILVDMFDQLFDSFNSVWMNKNEGKVLHNAMTRSTLHLKLWANVVPVLQTMHFIPKVSGGKKDKESNESKIPQNPDMESAPLKLLTLNKSIEDKIMKNRMMAKGNEQEINDQEEGDKERKTKMERQGKSCKQEKNKDKAVEQKENYERKKNGKAQKETSSINNTKDEKRDKINGDQQVDKDEQKKAKPVIVEPQENAKCNVKMELAKIVQQKRNKAKQADDKMYELDRNGNAKTDKNNEVKIIVYERKVKVKTDNKKIEMNTNAKEEVKLDKVEGNGKPKKEIDIKAARKIAFPKPEEIENNESRKKRKTKKARDAEARNIQQLRNDKTRVNNEISTSNERKPNSTNDEKQTEDRAKKPKPKKKRNKKDENPNSAQDNNNNIKNKRLEARYKAANLILEHPLIDPNQPRCYSDDEYSVGIPFHANIADLAKRVDDLINITPQCDAEKLSAHLDFSPPAATIVQSMRDSLRGHFGIAPKHLETFEMLFTGITSHDVCLRKSFGHSRTYDYISMLSGNKLFAVYETIAGDKHIFALNFIDTLTDIFNFVTFVDMTLFEMWTHTIMGVYQMFELLTNYHRFEALTTKLINCDTLHYMMTKLITHNGLAPYCLVGKHVYGEPIDFNMCVKSFQSESHYIVERDIRGEDSKKKA